MRPICLPVDKPKSAEVMSPSLPETEENGPSEVVKVDLFDLINKFEEHPNTPTRKNFTRSKSKSFSAGDKKKTRTRANLQRQLSSNEDDAEGEPIRVRRLLSRFESQTEKSPEVAVAPADLGERINKLEKAVRGKLRELHQLRVAWDREIEELLRRATQIGDSSDEIARRLLDLRRSVKNELSMSTNVKNIASGDYSKSDGENGERHEGHLGLKVAEIKSRYEVEAKTGSVAKEVAACKPQKQASPEVSDEEKQAVEEHDQQKDFHVPNNFVKQLSQAYEHRASEGEEDKASPRVPIEDLNLSSAKMITSYFNTLSTNNTENTEAEEEVPIKKDYVRKLSQVYEQNLKKGTEEENPDEDTQYTNLDSFESEENEKGFEEIPVQKNFVRNLSQSFEDGTVNVKEVEEVILVPERRLKEDIEDLEVNPEVNGEEEKFGKEEDMDFRDAAEVSSKTEFEDA